jgi:threonylcarbamoyladenosine tRNA methylthiotransferase MtaB
VAAASSEPSRVSLVSLGCRVNRADLDALAAGLGGGFAVAREGEPADFVVVNTCTVTADAESASRQAIRRAAREYPSARIVATGCHAQVDPRALAALPGVVAVVGARQQTALPELLRRLSRGEEPAAALARAILGAPDWTPAPLDLVDHTRAFLKIQEGCDARCSYCVVPDARGPARSLPFEEAVERVGALGRRHAEVVLTGIHLGVWGQDLTPRRTLAGLVREVAARRLVRRLRLSSVEPLEFPLELLLDADTARLLCEHFHVPLQSGSERLLAAMRRPYRPAQFAELVQRLAALAPGACIGTDVMAGFPGETPEDHRETVGLLESLPLAYLHVFTWSPRPGTDAAALAGRVPGPEASERARELLDLSDRRWRAFLARWPGHELEVVVERIEGGIARGTARQYLTVRWPAGAERRGALAQVRVEACDASCCFGVRTSAFQGRLPP